MSKFLQKIADKSVLLSHAEQMKKKRIKPGFDEMPPEKAYMWFEINDRRICKDILSGSFEPSPVIGHFSAKRNGGYRRFVRSTVIDAVIQHALMDELDPLCETVFSIHSHAYRTGRGVASAVREYCTYAEVFPYAAKIDPVSCFDNIDRDVLKKAVFNIISDTEALELIMKFVNAPVYSEGTFDHPEKGIFQGMALSNLLCNMYFHSLDMYLEKCGIPFVRYADDIVLFAATASELNRLFDSTKKYIEKELRLSINNTKSGVGSSLNISFLNHRFEKSRNGIIALENNVSTLAAYSNWHESIPCDGRGAVDILSNGILRQKDYSLLFDSETACTDIPVATTDAINIYSDVVFDSGFLSLALKNNIAVNVFNNNNKLIGRFVPNAPLRSPKITNEQLQAYCDPAERLKLAKTFVLASIHNTRLVIRYYNKQEPMEIYQNALNRINNAEQRIKNCKDHEALMIHEAAVREAYYSCYDSFIKNKSFSFTKRSRKPPLNEVNAMLSFGNTVLYNLLATYIYKSPLDVRVGFLHAANKRKESLNLDMAEMFKPLVVDRTVFSLINLNAIDLSHFRTDDNGGVYLNEEGKRIFLRAIYEKLRTVITVKDLKKSYYTVMKNEVEQLVKYFREHGKYSGFKQVR